MKHYFKFIASLVLCLGAGGFGSVFMVSSIPTWYATLNKPFFNPPNWIFGPVWTTLYILMAISLYLIWKDKKVPFIFFIQLILNSLWSIIFFGLKMPGLASLEIIILWFLIFITVIKFLKINKTAGILLLPYLFWVSFASLLNLAVWLLNK